MSKKTLALIIFLFLITCGLLYLALKTPPYQQSPTGPTPTPISVNAHTLLSLVPASASESSLLSSGQAKAKQYTVAVQIDTGDNQVNGIQLELAYDAQALSDITLSPGKFFQQPNALVSNVNTTDGRISYALTEQLSLPGRKGAGTVAYLAFNVAPTFTDKTTTITFLPKSAVAADKILESVLRKATGYQLNLATVSPTDSQATGSAVGNPYGTVTQPPQQ